jgi:hypothetical protein
VTKENISSVSRFLSTTTNIIKVDTNATNVLDIVVEEADNCPITGDQKITLKSQAISKSDIKDTSSIENTIKSSLENTLNNSAELTNGWLSIPGNANTNVIQNIKTDIQLAVEQTFTSDVLNEIVNSSFGSNNTKITMKKCKNSPINISQTLMFDILASNVLVKLEENLMKQETIASVINTADSSAKTTNKGADDFITATFDGIANVVGAVTGGYAAISFAILFIVLSICCGCCLILMMSGKAASGALPSASAASAAPVGAK